MTLDFRQTRDGVIVPIKVSAGSRSSGIRGVQDGVLKVNVTVAPEKGKANKAVVKLLADAWNLPKSAISIVAGTTSPRKQVLITGTNPGQLKSLPGIEQA